MSWWRKVLSFNTTKNNNKFNITQSKHYDNIKNASVSLHFYIKCQKKQTITISHWLPVKTRTSGSRVNVWRDNEALSSYRFKQLSESQISQFYRKPEYDCFSCISYKFILIVIEKYKHSTIFSSV